LVQIDDYVIGKKEGKLQELQPVTATEWRKMDMTYTEAMELQVPRMAQKKTHSVSMTNQLSYNHTASS
jgi:hypothetical protein